MQHRTDDSDPSSTLPRPELNPLLNPLLGENMGRWAEVYYTTSPERRQEAVLELLHQLELESAQRAEVVSAASEEKSAQQIAPAPELPAQIYCESCGHENPGEQKFCGMCGVPIVPPAAVVPSPEVVVPASAVSEVAAPELAREEHWTRDPELVSHPQILDEHVFPEKISAEEVAAEPPLREELPQPRPDDYPRNLSFLEPQGERAPRRNRLYFGAVLATLILALGYMAWRNAQSDSATTEPAPSQAPATQAAPSATASDRHPVDTTDTPRASTDTLRPRAPHPAASTAKESTTQDSARKPTQLPASAGGGAQELAIAQGYLNGTNGQQRNSAEAALWLWKAVQKRNAEATLLLSDLYLQGNGVPKNCDQAHVLLDAAASRGMRDAVERLRNLRAFGCE